MKKSFQKSGIAIALAAAGIGGAGMYASQSVAVELAPDNLGDVLLFPYYTMRNGYSTFLHVINTSNTKSVAYKLRVREGKNSRECVDFVVILSPNDVWTATLEEGVNGPQIRATDQSCTSGILTQGVAGNRSETLKHFAFTGANFDGGHTQGDFVDAIDRCREGYVEIIEMGASDDPSAGSVNVAATHINGVPADCNAVNSAFLNNIAAVGAEFDEPVNVLKGSYTLIKGSEGKAAGGDAVTLANFFTPSQSPFLPGNLNAPAVANYDGNSPDDLIFDPAALSPNLGDVNPARSYVRDVTAEGPQNTFLDDWAIPIDAVSAVIQRASVFNRWTSNVAAFTAETDWVVTAPTKNFYVDPTTGGSAPLNTPARPPFTETFASDVNNDFNGVSCDEVGLTVYDREEGEDIITNSGISPQPPTQGAQLCWEANVITFNDASVLGSKNQFSLNTNGRRFGWLRMSLNRTPAQMQGLVSDNFIQVPTAPNNTHRGMPVIGFSMTTRTTNATINNFGSLWDHAYDRDINS